MPYGVEVGQGATRSSAQTRLPRQIAGRTVTEHSPTRARRPSWVSHVPNDRRDVITLRARLPRGLLITVVLAGSVGLSALAATPAHAANTTYSQCNGLQDGAPGGGVTRMQCDIVIVNTITANNTRSSTVTVTRSCLGGVDNACPAGANLGVGNTGPVTSSSSDLITTVDQCNGSANGTAIMTPPIQCTVRITNNISAAIVGTISPATLNQCNDTTVTAANTCTPATATTTGATVTQCNESGQHGGGTVDCAFTLNSNMNDPESKVSAALPISINQCNGTGNSGGSKVVCNAFIRTNIVAVVVPTVSPTPSPTPVLPDETGNGVIGDVPLGGVAAGGGSTAGLEHLGWLGLGGGLLATSIALLALRRRTQRS